MVLINRKYLLTTLLLFIIKKVQSANILFVTTFPSISHQSVFQPIWKELSLRGHNVHVITPNPLHDPSLANLTEYDISSHYERLKNIPPELQFLVMKQPDFITVFIKDIVMTKKLSELSEDTFSHPEVQKLLKKDLTFDVAIVEWLFPTMSGFGAKYNCPLIGITSLGAPLVALDTVGNPSHPVTSPDMNLPVTRDMPFRERLLSALYSVYVRFWYHMVVLPREDGLVKKYLGVDLPYLGDIERNVSVLLLNRNPVFHRVMPVVPAVIELGTIELNRTRPSLDPELKAFLDNSKNGAIYFSLGSSAKSIYLPDNIRETLLTVFRRSPYNVVFKWENDTLPGKSDNVFISKWVPQITLLEHPNTKLFITQGGLQSSEEAIFAQIPIIGIPLGTDQTVNVDTFVKYGVGINLNLYDITVENLEAAIGEIMSKPSYKENAKRLARLMYDQPIDGLERATWWIEYVIRHKGAKHLRSTLLDVPWWQYFLLDVMGFIITLLFIISLVIYVTLKLFYKLVRKLLQLILPGSKKDVIKKNQ
ncbi:hypothetical protein NQ317_016532 [Molorchus minor]|uniref:UDP-glucuronosyltransferase n=1 Tax=Molorchus minor TaxID=1323400 RepID=A0ABQ9JTT3_9CUCU|nr:hypothetical protein NQ317_016532 [Molorchus minor]